MTDSYGGFLGGAYHLIPGRTSPLMRPIGDEPTVDGNKTTITINETIDGSVFRKWQLDDGYRPSNLKEWAQRRGVELGTIAGAVDAMTGEGVAA